MDSLTRFSTKRYQTPTLLQMEAVECGAVSLGIILGYFGLHVPVTQLRIACGISRDGSKASNIVKAARQYGLDARGFKKEIHELKDIDKPFIIFWKFYHFVVVEGFSNQGVWINDPATGPRRVTWQEFDESYTGVCLFFELTEKFQPSEPPIPIWKRIAIELQAYRTQVVFVLIAGISLLVPGLVIPAITRSFIDEVLVGGQLHWIWPILSGLLLTIMLQLGFNWLKENQLLKLETQFSISLSSKFMWHLFRLPVAFFNQRYAGEIGNRLFAAEHLSVALSRQISNHLFDIVSIFFFAIVMFFYDALLAVISITMAVLNFLALRAIHRKRVDTNLHLQQDYAKLTGISLTGLQLIETLKAMGNEGDFFARWAGHQVKATNTQQKLDSVGIFLEHLPLLLAGLNSAIILWIGGYRVLNGDLTIGMLVAFQGIMVSFQRPVYNLMHAGGTLQEIVADLFRLDDIFQNPIENKFQQKYRSALPSKLSGKIALQNITFGYSQLEPPLINDLTLTIEPGKRIALVGGSGSGKTTIVNQIVGLYKPWNGKILFDNIPYEEIPPATLTASMGVVNQEIFMFNGTVRDIVSLWDQSIPESDIIQACKDAEIHDEITARPGGYESEVQEGGKNFSGGQRQRLEIARTLSMNPTILILDEATSALDPLTEVKIDQNIRKRGCTCLIIAHRLSTIRDCDEIIVLKSGNIIQRGTHEELLTVQGYYQELIQSID
ncbi:MAG: NHLP family bacteriocin export ABC transporter peptidase/permease/ATPase subunit [Bacteroidia bacterium]|nr:NHLP family bacteriocin export ABC transporter peptidase/permease/ATPase subunit [Bacteroidia bacterium]